MAEGEDDSVEFGKARMLIENAKHLYFLGFGYHETNLRRLGLLPDADSVRVRSGEREGIRGTCYEMPHAQRQSLSQRYYGSNVENKKIIDYLENERNFLRLTAK